MKTKFYQKLKKECLEKESRLCIGLDVDYDLFPNQYLGLLMGRIIL